MGTMPHKRSHFKVQTLTLEQQRRKDRDAYYRSSEGSGRRFVTVKAELKHDCKRMIAAKEFHFQRDKENGFHSPQPRLASVCATDRIGASAAKADFKIYIAGNMAKHTHSPLEWPPLHAKSMDLHSSVNVQSIPYEKNNAKSIIGNSWAEACDSDLEELMPTDIHAEGMTAQGNGSSMSVCENISHTVGATSELAAKLDKRRALIDCACDPAKIASTDDVHLAHDTPHDFGHLQKFYIPRHDRELVENVKAQMAELQKENVQWAESVACLRSESFSIFSRLQQQEQLVASLKHEILVLFNQLSSQTLVHHGFSPYVSPDVAGPNLSRDGGCFSSFIPLGALDVQAAPPMTQGANLDAAKDLEERIHARLQAIEDRIVETHSKLQQLDLQDQQRDIKRGQIQHLIEELTSREADGSTALKEEIEHRIVSLESGVHELRRKYQSMRDDEKKDFEELKEADHLIAAEFVKQQRDYASSIGGQIKDVARALDDKITTAAQLQEQANAEFFDAIKSLASGYEALSKKSFSVSESRYPSLTGSLFHSRSPSVASIRSSHSRSVAKEEEEWHDEFCPSDVDEPAGRDRMVPQDPDDPWMSHEDIVRAEATSKGQLEHSDPSAAKSSAWHPGFADGVVVVDAHPDVTVENKAIFEYFHRLRSSFEAFSPLDIFSLCLEEGNGHEDISMDHKSASVHGPTDIMQSSLKSCLSKKPQTVDRARADALRAITEKLGDSQQAEFAEEHMWFSSGGDLKYYLENIRTYLASDAQGLR